MEQDVAKLSFEQAVAKLEEIVRELESGNPDLETSLRLFEEGVKLSRRCLELLDHAKGRICKLTQHESDEPKLEPAENEFGIG